MRFQFSGCFHFCVLLQINTVTLVNLTQLPHPLPPQPTHLGYNSPHDVVQFANQIGPNLRRPAHYHVGDRRMRFGRPTLAYRHAGRSLAYIDPHIDSNRHSHTPTATPEPTATPKPTPTREATQSVRPTPRPVNQPPEAAYDFEVETFDGDTLKLSDLKGRVVVLNFWASWCPPCRWEMPSFERISKEYSDKEVVFVGLALSDTLRDARGFADSVGVTYPLALDSTGRIAAAYNVRSLPTTFFIDREGQIQRRLTSVANEGVLKIFIRGQLTPTPGQGK